MIVARSDILPLWLDGGYGAAKDGASVLDRRVYDATGARFTISPIVGLWLNAADQLELADETGHIAWRHTNGYDRRMEHDISGVPAEWSRIGRMFRLDMSWTVAVALTAVRPAMFAAAVWAQHVENKWNENGGGS